ncbi:MAG TPA: hypothetical protein VMG34_15930 [Bacteroidota bacterium]|nr:hypothetical protein [Bacteroidota bacterium]
MAYAKGEGKTALAIFVDGLDVKFVHVALKNKQFHLEDFKTVNLIKKLEERQAVSEAGTGLEGVDLLDATSAAPIIQEGVVEEQEGSETNNSVMLGLLSDFPPGKYQFAYAISEPSVYYQTFEDSFGLSGGKLKKKLVEELSKIRATRPNPDAVAFITATEGQILSVIREDGLSLIDILENVKDFLGKRLPRIPFIETSDISLMNLVRANFDVGPEEISVIIYVGSEFSRLIFMKGSEFLHFAPVISEGRTSPNIENTLYSRILLEQDSAGIMRLDRIFLAGEAHKLELKQFLAPQFAEAPIEYLVPKNVDSGALQQSVEEIMSEYAVPISVAMRMLDAKNPRYYAIDLLPQTFREGQKVFKLAWHGYLLMVLIFLATLFLTNRVADLAEEVRLANRELQQKQLQQSENERLQNILDSLTVQNQQFVSALAVYDSLVPNYNRWSKVFYHLTHSVEDVNSVWISDIQSKPDSTIELTGYALLRPRIPRIANMFDKATLQSVEIQEIRGQTVYKFVLSIQKIDSD